MTIRQFKPLNRYLQIVPHFEDRKTPTGILLPEDSIDENPFVEASVVSVASDCGPEIKKSFHESYPNTMKIVVDKSMIESVDLSEIRYHLVLQNYVLGILKDV